jgi:hypothetical protein
MLLANNYRSIGTVLVWLSGRRATTAVRSL